MNYISLDFEYIETKDKTERRLVCVALYFDAENVFISPLLEEFQRSDFKKYLLSLDLTQNTFLGYAISGAEIPCLIQLMGEAWVKQMQWIDLWVEFKMWVLTHKDFRNYQSTTSLADCIECFGLEGSYGADKDEIRNLILYDEDNRKSKNQTRIQASTFHYTAEEMSRILHYCQEDVKILKILAQKIGQLSNYYEIPVSINERLQRGGFCKFSGISYALGNGFPMDIEKTRAVFENREKIKRMIQLECNHKIGMEIYRPILKNKTIVKYSFTHTVFEDYITVMGLGDVWEWTEKGSQRRLDESYLDEMLSKHKEELQPLYNARNTLKQLNSTDLAEIMSNEGYIKCPPFPFHQKTSRSSPKPTLGFILNLSPWLRMLIRPQKGRAFVGIDFKSQEILIAACLAKDPLMLQGYLTDFYMDTAIQTGFAPEGATKKTHNHIRNVFKPISLGTLFGMMAKSLAYKFLYLNPEWSYEDALDAAYLYLNNHKEKYYKYWDFVEKTFEESKDQGYYKGSGDSGWYYFVDENTRTTQLQNVPCQHGGAEMTRMSHDDCVKVGIPVITLHDALYFECLEEEAEHLAKVVSRIMCEASYKLLGYDYMSTETVIYTHDKPYYDSRGEDTYRLVMRELGFEIPNKFEKPLEILDIHKFL